MECGLKRKQVAVSTRFRNPHCAILMSRSIVIVMVKAPRAGFTKTRLAPQLSEIDAASLALCFVQDVVKTALRFVPNLIVAFAPADGRSCCPVRNKSTRFEIQSECFNCSGLNDSSVSRPRTAYWRVQLIKQARGDADPVESLQD